MVDKMKKKGLLPKQASAKVRSLKPKPKENDTKTYANLPAVTPNSARSRPLTERHSRTVYLPKKGFFKASDGCKLWFEDTGGEGLPLFFVYGLGCSIQHWKYPREHFSASGPAPRRQIYMDLRGHGKSPKATRKNPFTTEKTVQDLADLCSYLNVKEACFLGQSMGGSLIISLAYTHPQLVRKAVLLGSPSRRPQFGPPFGGLSTLFWRSLLEFNRKSPELLALLHRVAMKGLKKEPLKFMLREIIRHAGFNAELAKTTDIEEYIAKITAVDGMTFFQMAAALDAFDIKDYQGKVQTPLLLIAGAQDLVIPLSDQLRYKSYLPQTQIEIVPHGSHCPHFDDPKLVNQILESFLKDDKEI